MLAVWSTSNRYAGKTHRARELANGIAPMRDQYWKTGMTKWFDGIHSNTKVMVWDEFVGEVKGADLQLGFFLRLLDEYPLKVEKKCGHLEFNVPNIIFTSNYDPYLWFPSAGESSRAAWHRRLSMCTIEHKTVQYVPIVEEPIAEYNMI